MIEKDFLDKLSPISDDSEEKCFNKIAEIGNLPQNFDYIWDEARRFANFFFWTLHLNDNIFSISGNPDFIPECKQTNSFSFDVVRRRLVPEDRKIAINALATLVEQKTPYAGIVRVLRPSGLRRHIELRAYPVLFPSDTVTTIQGFARDVTDRISVKMVRHQVADHYRDFIDFSPHIPWIADPAGRIVEMSPRYEDLTGVLRSAWNDDSWLEHFHPDDIPNMVAAVTHSLATGEPYESEYRILFRDKKYHWVRASAVARRSRDGSIIAWYGVTEKIDLHKRRGFENNASGIVDDQDIQLCEGAIDAVDSKTIQERNFIDPSPIPVEEFNENIAIEIEGHHIRAARAILNWSASDLAMSSRLSASTVRRLEENPDSVSVKSRNIAIRALQSAGICFSRLRDGAIAISKIQF